MTENTANLMLEILKRIQADVGGIKAEVSGIRAEVGGLKSDVGSLKSDMSEVKGRLTLLETTVRKMRRDYAGILVMMRATAGHFDERVTDLDTKMDIMQSKG